MSSTIEIVDHRENYSCRKKYVLWKIKKYLLVTGNIVFRNTVIIIVKTENSDIGGDPLRLHGSEEAVAAHPQNLVVL